MPKFLLMVNHDNGVVTKPMDEWEPAEVDAHMAYYDVLGKELIANGEQIQFMALADPREAKIVRADGSAAPRVSDGPLPGIDGPFAEFKEWVAGFQVIDVASEARALEIAARVSAVPGPGGVPIQQPIIVREVVAE